MSQPNPNPQLIQALQTTIQRQSLQQGLTTGIAPAGAATRTVIVNGANGQQQIIVQPAVNAAVQAVQAVQSVQIQSAPAQPAQ